MRIAIRKEPNGSIYIDKNLRADIPYTEPPYNFTLIEVEKEDCIGFDFNDDLTFNLEKYNARKQEEINIVRIAEIKTELDELNKDFIQVLCGAVIPNYEEKKLKFQALHNEMRELQGKEPRVYEN